MLCVQLLQCVQIAVVIVIMRDCLWSAHTASIMHRPASVTLTITSTSGSSAAVAGGAAISSSPCCCSMAPDTQKTHQNTGYFR